MVSSLSRPMIAGLAVLAALSGPARAADDELELAFNDHCRECHSFLKDDNRLGPSLYGVVGRKAGTLPGYAFSEFPEGLERDLGRGDTRQMDRQPRRGDPRQHHEPALWRRGRSRDPHEDHRVPEKDLAGRQQGRASALDAEADRKSRRRPEIRPPSGVLKDESVDVVR